MFVQNETQIKKKLCDVEPGTLFSDGVNNFLRIASIDVMTSGELTLRNVVGVCVDNGQIWYTDNPDVENSVDVIVYPNAVVHVG